MKNKNKTGFTLEMYRNEVQNRLSIVQKWEEYSDHYLIDSHGRFAEFETNQRVAQMFKDRVAIYHNHDSKDQFAQDFVSDLERKNIRVYKYIPDDVSFELVEDPKEWFKIRFRTWRGNV
ncbi:predicted protein [Chaetoceros tenuissimus]|uniref:Uncharacterized protein n=1 Tax=Chaetoceros tenuissimus TaxID=426638 RepID=A0AAD3CZG0_9STRA|nr:predicted protein [Chaetoceros tenuissimus]